MELDSLEVRIILLLAGFGVVWQLLVIPSLVNFSFWLGLNPFFQYLLYNIGYLFLFVGLVGSGISLWLRQDLDFFYMLRSGLAAFLLFSLTFDMWQPPMAYNSCGVLLITNSATLVGTSVDRMAGFVFESLFPFLEWVKVDLSGFGLFCISLKYFFVYVVVPIVGFVLAALLLAGEEFFQFVFGQGNG